VLGVHGFGVTFFTSDESDDHPTARTIAMLFIAEGRYIERASTARAALYESATCAKLQNRLFNATAAAAKPGGTSSESTLKLIIPRDERLRRGECKGQQDNIYCIAQNYTSPP